MVSGPTPPGTGRHRAGDLGDAGMHVADGDSPVPGERRQPRRVGREPRPDLRFVGHRVDPDVDHDGPGLDELRRDEGRSADGGHQDVRRARHRRQIPRPRVADGHRRVAVQQQQRHRLADDVAAADDDRPRARDGDAGAVEQFDDARRRARRRGPAGSARAGRRWPGVKPSTSLAGSIASRTRVSASSPMPAGSGDCTRIPSMSSRPFSAATVASTSRDRRVGRHADQLGADAGLRRRSSACCGRRSRSRVVARQDDAEARRPSERVAVKRRDRGACSSARMAAAGRRRRRECALPWSRPRQVPGLRPARPGRRRLEVAQAVGPAQHHQLIARAASRRRRAG